MTAATAPAEQDHSARTAGFVLLAAALLFAIAALICSPIILNV
jgi:hypothetical protein